MNTLRAIEDKVISGQKISFQEALDLADTVATEELLASAGRIRDHFYGKKVDLCSIMNAKSGKCSENCRYCAQSAHYNTGIPEYPLVGVEEALKLAKENESYGVNRFALVTSGKAICESDLEKLIKIIKVLKQETKLKLCASLGCISYTQAAKLKEAGLTLYHHNVEASSDSYNMICDTHSYQDRIDTVKNAKAVGLEVCCGGIIGMGESMEKRIKMAFEIRELGIKFIPINILNLVKGTPMENIKPLEPAEVLRTFAIFRFINPDASIRYAGGRISLGDYQKLGFKSGIDSVMVGNYLTTVGNKISDDLKMIKELGLEI